MITGKELVQVVQCLLVHQLLVFSLPHHPTYVMTTVTIVIDLNNPRLLVYCYSFRLTKNTY